MDGFLHFKHKEKSENNFTCILLHKVLRRDCECRLSFARLTARSVYDCTRPCENRSKAQYAPQAQAESPAKSNAEKAASSPLIFSVTDKKPFSNGRLFAFYT